MGCQWRLTVPVCLVLSARMAERVCFFMSVLPGEAVILALESSAEQASAVIWRADGQHWQEVHAARHGHAAILTELARHVMQQAGVTAASLTHVAAGRGPGSFTGIRVGLAAAKGFALASGAAGIGVSCLAAMAHAVRRHRPEYAECRLLATADTRRGSYFCQMFGPAVDPKIGSTIDPANSTVPSIQDIASESGQQTPEDWRQAVVIGPGAAELVAAFPDRAMTALQDVPPVDALQVADLAAHRLRTGLAAECLTPLYVAPAFLGPAPSRPAMPASGGTTGS